MHLPAMRKNTVAGGEAARLHTAGTLSPISPKAQHHRRTRAGGIPGRAVLAPKEESGVGIAGKSSAPKPRSAMRIRLGADWPRDFRENA